jgi:hypothetical protein
LLMMQSPENSLSDIALACGFANQSHFTRVFGRIVGSSPKAWRVYMKTCVGKFCRERKAAVTERRQAVDVAMRSVEQTADPQTESAVRVVAWASRGMLQPTGDDFAMLRLILLALLPQIGGILLMVGRAHRC